jgi:hypothetical protein
MGVNVPPIEARNLRLIIIAHNVIDSAQTAVFVLCRIVIEQHPLHS